MKDPNAFFDNYPKNKDIFNFDKLRARPLYEIIPYEAEMEFHRIATTMSLNGNLQKKYQLMDDLARRLDLTLLARGTNRTVYTVNYDSSIVVKVGYDRAGISDSAREYENQKYLKPFCTKCFEVSPTGTVGLFERVTPVKHFEEFKSMAEDIFDMLFTKILGRFIMADIGATQYMNYGFREGFGPVILDYPYLYEVDESKLTCRNIISGTGAICGGKIDYDDEFEHLVCDRCGKQYSARDLAKELQHQKERDLFRGLLQEETTMKIKGYGNNASFDSEKGGKIQSAAVIPETIEATNVEVVKTDPATNTAEVTKDQIPPGTQVPKEYFDRVVTDAYLKGMMDGKAKAEEQQAQRIFNQQTDQQSAPVQKPVQQSKLAQKVEQPKQQAVYLPPPQQTQPSPKVDVNIKTTSESQPVKEKSVNIPAPTYRQYRDPSPRGKGSRTDYVGWQTPRRVGKCPIITSKPKTQQPESPAPKQNPQKQPDQPKPKVEQSKQQTPKQNERVFQNTPQTPVTPPKTREPYQPKTPQTQSVPKTDPKFQQQVPNLSPKIEQSQHSPKFEADQPTMTYRAARNKFMEQVNPNYQRLPDYIPDSAFSKENFDNNFVNSVTKHVMFFCIDNAERRDDVIYELAYITALYHLEIDPVAALLIPRKSITEVVRKIVDLIEDKLEGIGVEVEYEYDDEDRYTTRSSSDASNSEPMQVYDDTAFASVIPTSDEQEDRLSYDDRLRSNGITFGEGVVPNPQSGDRVLEEVGSIFKTDEIRTVAEAIDSNSSDPNDTSVSDELMQRINNQINTK